MFKLKHVNPEEAQGAVAEVYGIFPKGFTIPDPLQLMSVSPGLMQAQKVSMSHYMGHDKLSPALLASIRLLASQESCFGFCTGFNSKLLERMGMTTQEVADMVADPANAPLEPEEVALLTFAMGVLKDPAHATEDRIQALRAMGWRDSDIYDATALGVNMQAAGKLFAAFTK